MLFSEYFFTTQQLQGIAQNKYAASSSSLLDNSVVFPAFWDLMQKCLPKSLAPNAVTLIGIIVDVLGFLPLIYFSFNLKDERPTWVLAVAVACMFFYNTMDNLDGRHARSLGMGSVVGELFDHGLDSFANILQVLPVMIAIQSGKEKFLFSFLVLMLTDTYSLLFFCRKLVLGDIAFTPVDTTELQFIAFGGILVTIMFGPQLWDTPIPVPFFSQPLPLRLLFMVSGVFPILSNCIYQILKQMSSTHRGNVFYTFVQCIILWCYSWAIFAYIPGAEENCLVYFILIGGCFSKLITETVLIGVGATPNKTWIRTEHAVLVFIFLNLHFKFFDCLIAAYIGAFFTVSLWVLYFSVVVYNCAAFLKLPIFTVIHSESKAR